MIYVADEKQSLARMPRPDAGDNFESYHPCTLSFSSEWTIDSEIEDIPIDNGDAVMSIESALAGDSEWGETDHRLLGHPKCVQGPMEEMCQLASNGVDCGDIVPETAEVKALKAGTADWMLLLQIDTDEENPGWMWGDLGRLYFWIRRQDLSARDFSKCWFALQCY